MQCLLLFYGRNGNSGCCSLLLSWTADLKSSTCTFLVEQGQTNLMQSSRSKWRYWMCGWCIWVLNLKLAQALWSGQEMLWACSWALAHAVLGSTVAVSTKSQQCAGTSPWDFKNFPSCLELGFSLTLSSVLGLAFGPLSCLPMSACTLLHPWAVVQHWQDNYSNTLGILLRLFSIWIRVLTLHPRMCWLFFLILIKVTMFHLFPQTVCNVSIVNATFSLFFQVIHWLSWGLLTLCYYCSGQYNSSVVTPGSDRFMCECVGNVSCQSAI